MPASNNNFTADELRRRAGRYIRQPTGYSAFLPSKLPPDPPVRLDGRLQHLLFEADIAIGRLSGSINVLPNHDLFTYMYVRKEAVLSSQIEGIQSSLQDVLTAEAQIQDDKRPRDVEEVINYVGAMNYGIARLAKLPMSARLTCEIHKRLMHGDRRQHLTPGELRKSQNWIGPAGCTLNTATYVPPPPNEIAGALGELDKFLHKDGDLPLLIKIGLAHVQFEAIHPFLDGNGRTGRLLISLFLCEKGVLQKPVLYLSLYLLRHRQRYYELLQATRDEGDWEGWLEFFLKGVAETSALAAETARLVFAMREKHYAAIATNLGRSSGNAHIILRQFFFRPIMSINDIRDLIGTTYPTANNLVEKLVELGILEEITGQVRNRKFCYRPYVRLFDDEPKTHS